MSRASGSYGDGLRIVILLLRQIASVKDDPNLQTATRAYSNLVSISKVINVDFESVATRAWIVVNLKSLVEGHILDLDLIVDIAFFSHLGGATLSIVLSKVRSLPSVVVICRRTNSSITLLVLVYEVALGRRNVEAKDATWRRHTSTVCLRAWLPDLHGGACA